ncbi:MAG: hypothetical protein KJ732_07265 [Candidatus Margulisbacteria bacterium]|nr:hypothetical protein [Candidatus Margulisiibacteriota bacterium]
MTIPASIIQNIESIIERDDICDSNIPGYFDTSSPGDGGSDVDGDCADVTPPGSNPPSPPPPPPPGSGGGSTNDPSNYLDTLDDIDDAYDGLLDDVSDDSDLYSKDGDFYYINEELWEMYYRRLQGLMNFSLMIALSVDSRREANRRLFESFSDLPPDPRQINRTSVTEGIAKSNEKFMKFFNKAQVILLQKVQAMNDKIYADMQKKIEEDLDGFWESVGNYFSSGSTEKGQLDDMKDLNEDYKRALDHNLNSLRPGMGFEGLNDAVDNNGEDIFSDLVNADDFIKYNDNGYIDLNASKGWIVGLRDQLTGLLNFNRMVVGQAAEAEEAQKVIWETFNEQDAGSTKMKIAETAVEQAATHTLMLFDKLASTTLQQQSIRNQITHVDKQIEKFDDSLGLRILAGVGMIIAVIVGIIGTCLGGWGAVILGGVAALLAAGSAVAQYGSQKMADSVDDEYVPSLPNADGPVDFTSGRKSANHKLNESQHMTNQQIQEEADCLADKQDALMSQIGMGFMDTIDDGYFQVNFSGLAGLAHQLAGIQNMIRAIQKSIEQRAAAKRTLFRAYTGLRAGSDSPLIKGALEGILNQANVQFQSLSSYLGEVKQAHNWERQQEMAMDRATTTLVISLVTAGLCAGIGAVGGVVAGSTAQVVAQVAVYAFTIGQMLGNAIAGIINALAGAWGNGETSYEASFDPDTSAVRKDTTRSAKGDYADYIDHELNELYSEMLNFSKSIISAGDDRVGIDPKLVSKLQKKLAMINNLITLLTSNQKLKASAKQILASAYGVSVESAESVEDLGRALIETNNQTFNFVKKLVGEKVEVMNRAAAAEDEVTAAGWKLGISVVAAGVGIALGSTVNIAFLGVTSALMQISNAIFDIANSLIHAKEDYGAFDKYAQENNKSSVRSDSSRTQSKTMELADVLDAQLAELSALDSSCLDNVGTGNIGLNMGTISETQLAMEKAFRIAGILTSIQQSRSEIQAKLSGKGSIVSSSAMDQALGNIQESLSAIVDSETEALETVVSRNNEMNAATRQAWQAGIKGLIAAASLIISLAKADLSAEVNVANDKIANDQVLSEDNVQALKQNPDKIDTLSWVGGVVGMLGVVSDIIVGEIYDACQESESYDERGAAEKVDRKQAAESRAGDFADKMGAAEETTASYRAHTGTIGLQTQSINIAEQNMYQMVEMLQNLTTTLAQFIADRLAPKPPENGLYPTIGNEEQAPATGTTPADGQGAVPEVETHAGEAAAATDVVVAQAERNEPATPPVAEEQANRPTATIEYMDQLIAQRETQIQELAQQIQTLSGPPADGEQPEGQVEPPAAQVEQVANPQTEMPESQQFVQEVSELVTQVQQLAANINQAAPQSQDEVQEMSQQLSQVEAAVGSGDPAQVTSAIRNLNLTAEDGTQITTPEQLLDHLETQIDSLLNEWSQLTAQRQQLEDNLRSVRIEQRSEALEGELRTEIESLVEQQASIQAQIDSGAISQSAGETQLRQLQERRNLCEDALRNGLLEDGTEEQFEQMIQGVQQRIGEIRGELTSLRQQVTRIRTQLEQQQ